MLSAFQTFSAISVTYTFLSHAPISNVVCVFSELLDRSVPIFLAIVMFLRRPLLRQGFWNFWSHLGDT